MRELFADALIECFLAWFATKAVAVLDPWALLGVAEAPFIDGWVCDVSIGNTVNSVFRVCIRRVKGLKPSVTSNKLIQNKSHRIHIN